MSATVIPPAPAPPITVHSCPSCSHWLPDGTLACPDCQTLTYGQYLSGLAAGAQELEQEQKIAEARERWVSALQWLPQNTQQAESIQHHIAQLDAKLQAENDTKAKWKKRLGPFAPIALFLIKAKSWLLLAVKFKFLLSGLLYFAVYWALFGWQFALGLTLVILIHEMGHYFAARMRGLKANLPMFLPGFGAYVKWYGQGVSKEDLASISLAGPFAGLIAAVACLGLHYVTPVMASHGQGGELFLTLANLGAWLNLLNLFPVPFLVAFDGAQAVFALSRLQRGLIAATCLLFFALSATGATGDSLVGPNTIYTFLILAAGMGWKCMSRDIPEKSGSRSFVYFLLLIIALGFVMMLSPIPG